MLAEKLETSQLPTLLVARQNWQMVHEIHFAEDSACDSAEQLGGYPNAMLSDLGNGRDRQEGWGGQPLCIGRSGHWIQRQLHADQ